MGASQGRIQQALAAKWFKCSRAYRTSPWHLACHGLVRRRPGHYLCSWQENAECKLGAHIHMPSHMQPDSCSKRLLKADMRLTDRELLLSSTAAGLGDLWEDVAT